MNSMRSTSFIASFALCVAAGCNSVWAQRATDPGGQYPAHTKIELDNGPKQDADHVEVVAEKAAVLPWTFIDGTKAARRTVEDFMNTILSKSHLETVPQGRVAAALDEVDDAERTALPSPQRLLRLGQQLGVDYVIAPRAKWHTRSIWVAFGPKTKSDCTVDLLIVDVKNSEIALHAKQVRMDDTAKEPTLSTIGTLFISPLFTVLSGGPKSPHEQRAGQLAIAKAIQPWIDSRGRKLTSISTSVSQKVRGTAGSDDAASKKDNYR